MCGFVLWLSVSVPDMQHGGVLVTAMRITAFVYNSLIIIIRNLAGSFLLNVKKFINKYILS